MSCAYVNSHLIECKPNQYSASVYIESPQRPTIEVIVFLLMIYILSRDVVRLVLFFYKRKLKAEYGGLGGAQVVRKFESNPIHSLIINGEPSSVCSVLE